MERKGTGDAKQIEKFLSHGYFGVAGIKHYQHGVRLLQVHPEYFGHIWLRTL